MSFGRYRDNTSKGKVVALFGLGDQEGYGEWFLDAMGLLHDELKRPELNLLASGQMTTATNSKRLKRLPKTNHSS